jgi:hypothetical protein
MKYTPCKLRSINSPKKTTTIVSSGPPQTHPDYYPFQVDSCDGSIVLYQFQDPVYNITTQKWKFDFFYAGYNGTIIQDGIIHNYIGSTYAGTLASCP